MRAVRFAGVGRPAQIADIPEPSPGPGQIVVKIGGAGVCLSFGPAHHGGSSPTGDHVWS